MLRTTQETVDDRSRAGSNDLERGARRYGPDGCGGERSASPGPPRRRRRDSARGDIAWTRRCLESQPQAPVFEADRSGGPHAGLRGTYCALPLRVRDVPHERRAQRIAAIHVSAGGRRPYDRRHRHRPFPRLHGTGVCGRARARLVEGADREGALAETRAAGNAQGIGFENAAVRLLDHIDDAAHAP